MMGFSGAGHLSLMTATHFDLGDEAAADPVERPPATGRGGSVLYAHPHKRLAELAGENASRSLCANLK
jgi:hypothetical protein